MKFGIKVTCDGIISVISNNVNKRLRYLNRIAAKQNAAIAQVSNCPTVVKAEIIKLLKNSRGKLMWVPNSSLKLLSVAGLGMSVLVYWSAGNLNDVAIIHKKGVIMKTAPKISRE